MGVFALAESLKTNNTLEHLYLHANAAGDGGGLAMAAALEVNHGLTELTLSQNELCGPAIVALGNMLKKNTTLQSLSLMRLFSTTEKGSPSLINTLLSKHREQRDGRGCNSIR